MNFFNIFFMRKIDRFDKYMAYNGLNDNKVTTQLGLSVGVIGKSRQEGRDLSGKVLEKILNYYNDLNGMWLLTGEGEMLNNSEQNGLSSVTVDVNWEERAKLWEKIASERLTIIELLKDKIKTLENALSEQKSQTNTA